MFDEVLVVRLQPQQRGLVKHVHRIAILRIQLIAIERGHQGRDRFRLELLDTILSGQSGRLFTELRDRQSLAYSLSSFSLFGLDTGSFGIYIGTSPDKMEQAIKGIWQEMENVRREKVSDEELNRAKNILISQYELAMQTHSAQALEMGLNETYDLGQDFGSRYIETIKGVTAEEILAAAQQYILPDQYIMVAVGSGLPAGADTPPGTGAEDAAPQNNR